MGIRTRIKSLPIYLYIIFAVVVFVNVYLLVCHEPWRDEAQAWLIARDVKISDLFLVLSQEGHPLLWYAVLFPFARLGIPYIALNIISSLLVDTALFFLLLFAPFRSITKAVLAVSPMFVYFVSVISRSYSLCALLVILIAAVYHDRSRHSVLYGFLIALLFQTHMLMVGMAFILWYVWLLSFLKSRKINKGSGESSKSSIVGLLLPFLSIVLLVAEFSGIFTSVALSKSIVSEKPILLAVFGIIAALFLALIAALVLNKRSSAFVYLNETIIGAMTVAWQIAVFFVYRHMTSRWITIVYAIVFIVWIILDIKKETPNKDASFLKRLSCPMALNIYLILFIVGYTIVTHGYSLAIKDIQSAYSDSKNAAEFINEQISSDSIIVCNSEESCNALVPYLDGRTIYSPFSERELSFVNRDARCLHSMSYTQFVDTCRRMFPDEKSIYCVFSRETALTDVPEDLFDYVKMLYQSRFDSTIYKEEYSVFILDLK